MTTRSFRLLLTNLCIIFLVFPVHGSWNEASSDAEKVDLALYYETLCPYCAKFIVNNLVKVLEKDLMSIVNLRLVPWGNAVILNNGTVLCQHGEDECRLNTVEACIIRMWPDAVRHLKYIQCIESRLLQGIEQGLLKPCFETGEELDSIDRCSRSAIGSKIEEEYRIETGRLSPPHQYVPWVVVNNKPLLAEYTRFIEYVCKAYKGTKKLPEACIQYNVNESPTNNRDTEMNEVCYAAA